MIDNNNKPNLINKIDLMTRASRPNSTVPRPFLRWAGSKRSLLRNFIEFLPDKFNTYYEPFLGSGALYFLLKPQRAIISDSCGDLVDTFYAIKDNVSSVLRYIKPLKPDKEIYYSIRENRSKGRFKRAAEFIYLNKTCWNGLYRVNSKGKFNVPYGMPKSDRIVDEKNLRRCSDQLRSGEVEIYKLDFSHIEDKVKEGDLVYLDPPYVTGYTNNGFRDYNETLFSWEDQERLARLARTLKERGAKVIVSNAYHASIIELYGGFYSHVFSRKSTIASDITKRGITSEVILCS